MYDDVEELTEVYTCTQCGNDWFCHSTPSGGWLVWAACVTCTPFKVRLQRGALPHCPECGIVLQEVD